MTIRWTHALAIGVVVGLVLPSAILGVGASHVVCESGGVIGWSQPLLTPLTVALAPPGGAVNDSYLLTTNWSATNSFSVGGSSTIPSRASVMDLDFINWTIEADTPVLAPGWGSNAHCAPIWGASNAGPFGLFNSCGGCVISNATPAGVGERTVIPPGLNFSVPVAVMNLSYGASPIGSLAWSGSVSVGASWSASASLGELGAAVAPFYEHGNLTGLGITIIEHQLTFEIPVDLTNGSTATLPVSIPADWPVGPAGGTSLEAVVTYVLPLTVDQGDWEVYLAGGGSAISTGGLLFEQTSQS